MSDLEKKLSLARSRAERLKKSQKESESLLEAKSRELYQANVQLEKAQEQLQTEIKQATYELRVSNHRLKKSLREKSSFIGAISHEIRTPLNAIIGLSELLKLSELNPEQSAQVETVFKSADSLMGLINELLEITQIESGRAELRPEVVDVASNTEFIASLSRIEAKKRNLNLSVKINEMPSSLLFDVRRYNQVLNNLISNALKHTDAGSIDVVCDFTPYPKDPKLGTLTTRVIDTGKGISEESQKRIFNMYEQIGNPTQGIGLGLPICKQLCALMLGKIRCESVEGEGSVFSFSIPVEICETKTSSNETRAENARSMGSTESIENILPSLKILVAEDNVINQQVLTAQLQQLQQTAEIVEHGGLALERLSDESYDVVFLDIMMPVMDGKETLRKIRESEPRIAQHRCVALTAASFQEQGEHLLSLGFDQFLSKPLTLNSLREALLEASGGQSTDVTVNSKAQGAHFLRLKQELGDGFGRFFSNVAPIFLAESTKRMQHLVEAIEQKDHDATRFTSHAMKGEAYALELNVLAGYLKQLETEKDPERVLRLLDDAKNELKTQSVIIKNELQHIERLSK